MYRITVKSITVDIRLQTCHNCNVATKMATGGADPGEAERHVSECPVCLEVYVDPKVLPCDHSLCARCRQQLKQGSRIECPLCKVVHDVSRIRPDFRLQQFLDALTEKQKKERLPTTTQHTVEVTVSESEIGHDEPKPVNARDGILLKTEQERTQSYGSGPVIHKFARLRQKCFVLQRGFQLRNKATTVRHINDDVWVCEMKGIIQVFDRNLEYLRLLSDQRWGDVCDVTQLPNGDVVFAGSGGLFHLTATGETKTAIDTVNKYTSSVIVNDNLFANCNDPPRLIVYTMQNDRWETRDTISLAGVVKPNACLTLATANGKIFACSDDDGEVFVLSQSGEVLQTHGKPGSGPAGELNYPRLCAVDSEESMLVADWGNDRLQVCDVSGQWSVLDLQPPVKRPSRAAVIDNKLYVVCSWDENTLSVYTSE